MGSTDLHAVERRARWAYERGMLRRAAIGALPMTAAAAVALLLARDLPATGLLAAFVVLLAVGSFWWRRGAERAAAIGFLAGLVPYAASIGASRLGGHVCTPGGCVSLCLPACTVAGAIAGALVAQAAARRRAGPLFWVTASAMTVSTGALGCSCAGFAGAYGMLAGLVLTVVPIVIASRWRSRP